MKFMAVRETRNNPTEFRKAVERDDIVLTAGGRPFAIAIGVGEEDLEETLGLIRRVRALRALSRLQDAAVEGGTSDISPDEIEKEIRGVRRERKRRS